LAAVVGCEVTHMLYARIGQHTRHLSNCTVSGVDVYQLVIQVPFTQPRQLRINRHYRLTATLAVTTSAYRRVLFTRCRISCPVSHSCQANSENNSNRKSTRLTSSHVKISYAVFCL